MSCTIFVAKTKALISHAVAVTARLISAFVFVLTKLRFSLAAALLLMFSLLLIMLVVNMYMYDTKMLCKQCELFSKLLFGNIDV